MRIGVTLPSRTGSISDVVDKARRADQAGFQSVWTYEVYRDPFTLLGGAAANTERATLGTGLAMGFSRSPFAMANAAADIDEMSGGRMLLGFGTGIPEFLRAFHSTDAQRAIGRMSEYIDVLRLSWEYLSTGRADRLDGQHYQFKAPRVNPWGKRELPRQQIPIGVAALGPKMLELCGRKGDVWLGYFTTKKYVDEFVREHLEIGARKAGRDGSQIPIYAEAVCSVSPDRDLAMRRARKQVGFYVTHPAGAQAAAMHGLGDLVTELRENFLREGLVAFEKTDDRLVDLMSITGTPEEAREKLTHYADFVDHIMLHTPYVPPIEAEESEDAFANIIDAFGDLARDSGPVKTVSAHT
jgi:alkanesulfonate monooxygenase SsuD/methylene tetrahydromethanopterin reductase-like flavin-dependent oxidoreductase (luciferase family)